MGSVFVVQAERIVVAISVSTVHVVQADVLEQARRVVHTVRFGSVRVVQA